ncbi:host specificity protein J, partial [Salmonella enterica subsp. enterica serovar Typhimurium]|nr:host specificity protein J [Salmonella enterica subsp. enterica serovar Typhimurium]
MNMEQFKKKRLPLLIAGAGGKKSSGSSRTPVEADDTVNSRAMASILDLLGEGVIGGLVDGAKSIFIDDLPILNEDGSPNFSGITWDFRDGSQDQTPMAGFDFVETPKSVNIQLKRTHDVTIAIDNDEADRVRVILKFPSLRSVDKKTGDTNGTTVKYKFQIANGDNAFKDAIAEGESSSEVTLTAKKTGVYYRSYELKLPKPGRAYKIRVIRITEDSNTQYIFNDTWVDSIGEIVDTPMNYPNSALVGLKVNSEQFGSSMPSRSYLVRGLKIRVPSNYNENTNTYIGVWDGTFKLLSSSNPAWILFDVLTNARYGLGQFVSESMIDLGQIYQIGRYCDEEVDNGFGGKEKRFAINTQITSRQDAYRLIQDIAGAFRGMVFWAGGMVNVMQDSPSDPVMMFTNANVKDGMFSYKGSARKDRPSVALVTYNNKEDGYKQNIEYVEDQEAMRRYGERKTEVVAFGCTSRGQAHRVGLWLLYTARMESDVISFTAGLDASFLMPGETVLIQNKYRAGKRNSGRIVAFTKNSITLDAPVTLNKAGSYIRILNQEGEIVERDILETGEDITNVTFSKALNSGDMPVMNGVWTITEPDLEPMRVRVINVAQGDAQGTFDVTVVQNNASKYEAIDNGATLIPENNTVLDPTYSKPTNLQVTEGTYISSPGNLSIKLVATWEGKSAEYWISWRRSDENNVSNWQSARVTEEQFEILNIAENGQYDIQLYAVSFSGKKTDIISTVYQVKGTMTPPGSPTSLTAVGDYRNVILNWVNPDSIDLDHINVYASQTNDLETAKLIAEVASTTFAHAGLGD